jgi:E3 ubiquitin-protein ligase HUWE1
VFQDKFQDYFKFIGRVIAKALLTKNQCPVNFAPPIYKLLVGKPLTLSDFQLVHPGITSGIANIVDYYVQLCKLFQMSEQDILDLEEYFVITFEELDKKKIILELKKDGEKLQVTKFNLVEYFLSIAKMKMFTSVQKQIESFLAGFFDVIPLSVIQMFSEVELELILCGMKNIDVLALKKKSFIDPEREKEANWFWEIFENPCSGEEKAQKKQEILHWITGCSFVPVIENDEDGKLYVEKSFSLKNSHPYAHTWYFVLSC